MTINMKKDNEKLTVILEGRLDTTTAPQLENELKENITNVKELIFDFAGVEYISSAGLRIILSMQKIMSNQGKMIVRNANETVMEVFEITGFLEIISVE